ncbi:elongation factor G [Azospirillum sp.]|uniref:elongation factor G n=1 Tax=Azospirillum sp. TaxID=34012 RepID=UPI003D757266
MPHSQVSTARCAALVGPYLSGKTTLLESLLFATGAVTRKGSVRDGNAVGDSAPEAKARQMSVEVNLAHAEYLGERWHFLDCPGSVELTYETQCALMACDVAVIVAEPSAERAVLLAPLFKFLDDNQIPHILFINKVDTLGDLRIRDVVQAYQAVSSRPLVLREVPFREGDKIAGYVDLVSERAYHFNPHKPSDLVQMPDSVKERESEARQEMLEALADFDDGLLEQLLEDVRPDPGKVYEDFAKDLAEDLIVPVFLGSAENDGGIRRLLKALRHEGPEVTSTAEHRLVPEGVVVAQVFKNLNAAHAGKLSFARVWRGTVTDGMTLGGERVSGVYHMMGHDQQKLTQAAAGEVVALGRLEKVKAGDILTDKGNDGAPANWPEVPSPVYGLAVNAENRNDEVKLTGAIQKLIEEDPSLRFEQSHDTGEMVIWGHGDIHLQITMDRLRSKYNVPVKGKPPQVPYKETIRKGVPEHHARFKRQTGGHGQFADIVIQVSPQPRGSGFSFKDAIVGGVVPRNFIPAVEAGIREYTVQGPLGFPVVDFAVSLTGGQYHAVDSSEMAFKTVARQAMQEALPSCEPVLLEPILQVCIAVPSEFTPKVQRLVSGRRGQILGFDARPGWQGWDEVKAYMPQAEIHDLIVELRSLSLGVGTFTWTFERLQELTGKMADKAVEQRKAALAHA